MNLTGLKTAVFIAAAAFFHVLATLIIFSAFLFLYALMIIPHIPAAAVFPGFPLFFSVAFILAAFLYRKALKVTRF